jgi:ABC-type transport system substrate-binding protein
LQTIICATGDHKNGPSGDGGLSRSLPNFIKGDGAMNREGQEMGRNLYAVVAAGTLLITIAGAESALAEIPMMGVFNNLVLYKQDVAQNSLQSIVPDLATDWSWNEDGTELTFRLRSGVKWHDGHPFTANDVNCTWDLLLGIAGEAARQSAQGLVPKRRNCHR